MKNWKLPELLNTPMGLVVALGALIAAVEFGIMVVLHDVAAPLNIPEDYWDYIDTILLTLIVSPALYFLVFRKMRESEEHFRQINASVQDAIIVVNEQCLITEWNLAAQKMFQYSREEALGRQMYQLLAAPRYRADAARGFTRFEEIGTGPLIGKTTEVAAVRKDGSEFPIELSISAAKVKGRWHAMGVMRDITGRKRAEAELRIAATAFETHEGMMVTDAHKVILRINNAFTEITGYTTEEAVGQTPRLFKSGRHDAAFYAAMWESIRRSGSWQGEIWDRRKNGEVYPEQLTITAVKGDAGEVTHYVATLHDITLRKKAEEQIRNLAFHDTLTQLPNRRLLNDRLGQTMAASKRSGRYGALMFLDLDNFKPLNDSHGHDVGDLLLIEVAHRITRCVREVDTVARFGGDEFVVMLSELDEDKAASIAQAGIIAEKIRATLAEPYALTIRREGEAETTVKYRCTSSIGMVLFIGHQASPEDILKWADMAMYQAKEGGRNRISFFDQTMQSASQVVQESFTRSVA